MPLPNDVRILLVDDEEVVRNVVGRVLQVAGYQVLMAHNALEALDLCQESEGAIHIAVLDSIMPGMNGFDLLQRLKLLKPGIRILMTSGYPEQYARQAGDPSSLPKDYNFLQKPFTPKKLLEAVRNTISQTDVCRV